MSLLWACVMALAAAQPDVPSEIEVELVSSGTDQARLQEIRGILRDRLEQHGLLAVTPPCPNCGRRLEVILVAGIERLSVELRGAGRSTSDLIPLQGGREQLGLLIDRWALEPKLSPDAESGGGDGAQIAVLGLAGGGVVLAIAGLIAAVVAANTHATLVERPLFGAEVDDLNGRLGLSTGVAVVGVSTSLTAIGSAVLVWALTD